MGREMDLDSGRYGYGCGEGAAIAGSEFLWLSWLLRRTRFEEVPWSTIDSSDSARFGSGDYKTPCPGDRIGEAKEPSGALSSVHVGEAVIQAWNEETTTAPTLRVSALASGNGFGLNVRAGVPSMGWKM